MFSAEIKINGTLISHIYGHREGIEHYNPVTDENSYVYNYYEVGEDKLISGRLTHKYSGGIHKLVRLILEDIDESQQSD